MKQKPSATLTCLAKYMAAESAKKRREIVYDRKFPDPEGKAQAHYYTLALECIREYISNGRDIGLIDHKIRYIDSLLLTANGSKATKLVNNRRVLQEFVSAFSNLKLELINCEEIVVESEGVTVKLFPDLVLKKSGKTVIVKCWFNSLPPSKAAEQSTLQLLWTYASEAKIVTSAGNIQLWIMKDGAIQTCSGRTKTFDANFKRTLREFKFHWSDVNIDEFKTHRAA